MALTAVGSRLIVTHTHTRIGFAIVQSLSKAGYSIIAGSRRLPSMCGSISGVIAEFEYPDPFVSPGCFVETLKRVARNHAVDAVLPLHEETFVLSAYRSDLEQLAEVLAPPIEVLMRLHDKALLPELGHASRIATPKTSRVSSHADVMAAAETIGLPLVLKPRFGSGASGLRFITSSKELTRSSEFDSELSKRYFLAQQWVPGRGVGIGALVLNGQVLAVAGHLRLREIPISGGASTARVTFRHVEMEAAAAR